MASKQRKSPAPAPKVSATRVPPHPKTADPQHQEWLVDEGADESFTASDPSAIAQPHPHGAPKKGTAKAPLKGK